MMFDSDESAPTPEGRGFVYYHPYLTYSNPDNDGFIDRDGKPSLKLSTDTDALFSLGKEAYMRLTHGGRYSREEFVECYKKHWARVDNFRNLFTQGILVAKNAEGQPISFDIDKLEDSQIIGIFWQICLARLKQGPALKDDDQDFFLFHALWEIDNALVGIALETSEAVYAAIEARKALSTADAIASGDEQLAQARRRLGYEAAIEKLRRDPKQLEKAFVRECWEKWQENPHIYKSKAAFARDMLSKCEHLKSVKKIEDWCREWAAEAKG